MVHHIVMWKFKDDVKEEQKAALKKAMEENLTGLVGKIDGLLTAEFVKYPLPSATHEMALLTTFETAEDVARYAKRPEHVKVADAYIRPYVKDRACLDY